MVTVALVGASTGFGRTVLMTFIHINNKKHKLVLLSRSEQPVFAAQGVDVRQVDYTSHEQLVKALEDVHTALSFIGAANPNEKDPQLALLEACQEAGVRRFSPSEYAFGNNEGIDLYAGKARVWEATKQSGLEYTRFNCGLFISALATGTPKPMTDVGRREGRKNGEDEALAGLRPWNYIINMKAGTADYPLDGTPQLCWTDIRDVAHFVFRALDLEQWPAEMGVRGDVKSFKEIVEIVERVQGRKFLTKNNSVEELSAKVDDPGKTFYNQGRLAIARGDWMVGDNLNEAFPDFKPINCEAFVDKWWDGVELDEPAWGEDQSFM